MQLLKKISKLRFSRLIWIECLIVKDMFSPYISPYRVHISLKSCFLCTSGTSWKKNISEAFPRITTGEYHCPVLNKVFTEFTHIVAVKTTGNVFCYEVCIFNPWYFHLSFSHVLYSYLSSNYHAGY